MVLQAQDGEAFFGCPTTSTFRPKFYFFYGSLMDPSQIVRVLGLREHLVTRPASIVGYSCKMWGPYPALVDGPPDAIVHGVAFEVQSQQAAARLAEYETDAYEEQACFIRLEREEPRTVFGMTFKWKGDVDDEDLREGNFNLEEWQSQNR